MPPRIGAHQCIRLNGASSRIACKVQSRFYAAAAAAITPAPSPEQLTLNHVPIERYPPTQPPSHKNPAFRKSQLHRQYTSLLQTTPLMLIFQHNNLLASEWAAIRRELYHALERVSAREAPAESSQPYLSDNVKLQVIQTGIFSAALRVVEFYNPDQPPPSSTSTSTSTHASDQEYAYHTHLLSEAAFAATRLPLRKHGEDAMTPAKLRTNHRKRNHPLHKVLSGPIAVLAFPQVAPAHLAAALSVLAPTSGRSSAFPAPRKKDAPTYYDAGVQAGLAKLLFLGARVEGRVMDQEGVRWVGGIAGGLDGLRAQVVALLQGVGAGVTNVLEGAGKSLWVTMEGRRVDLEDREKGTSNGSSADA